MFGTGKVIEKNSIDFNGLAMLYLQHRCDDSLTPEDYLVRFIQVREAMYKRFEEEPLPPKKVSAPPQMPLRVSPWR